MTEKFLYGSYVILFLQQVGRKAMPLKLSRFYIIHIYLTKKRIFAFISQICE